MLKSPKRTVAEKRLDLDCISIECLHEMSIIIESSIVNVLHVYHSAQLSARSEHDDEDFMVLSRPVVPVSSTQHYPFLTFAETIILLL